MIGFAALAGWTMALPRWWMAEFDAVLPDALRPVSRAGRHGRLLVAPGDGSVSVALLDADGRELFVENAAWTTYTRAMLDRCRHRATERLGVREIAVSLALPHAVSRSMLIPRRARAQALGIIRDYIARKIPLPLDEIVIGWGVEVAGAGKLLVNYVALPRTLLERTFDRLGVGAGDVALIEDGTAAAIPLAGPLPESASGRARLAAGCAMLTLLAAVAAFGILAVRQGAALAALDENLRLSERPMQQRAEHSRAVTKLTDDLAAFARWRSMPGVNRVWEELAIILPSTSYLTDLEISETGLQFSGFSASTPELIRLLEASAVIRQAALSGPITFDQAKGRDRFAIQASLTQPRAPVGGEE